MPQLEPPPPTPAPAWIPLEACTTGEGRIRLLEAATETVIAETTITIAAAGDGVSSQTGNTAEGASGQAEDEAIEPQQQGCGLIYELPCPPAPSIGYTTSPSAPSANYSITVRWGVNGCDEYKVSGGLGSYQGSSTSKTYSNRPCERSYNVSAQSHGDSENYAPVWSNSSSRTVTTPQCPETPPTETPTPTNRPPAFSSSSTTRRVDENTPSGRNIGSPVTATDPDGDTLTYSIGGSSFSIVSSTGQLRTKAALDYETTSSYSVSVTAKDPSNASDSIMVTINVGDVEEGNVPVCNSAPSLVRNLEVNPGDRRLDLDWDRPSVDGDCDIEYKVQRKLASSGTWGSTRTVTTSRYSITGLANGTEYDVQVRACNDEGCGGWYQKSETPRPPPEQVLKPSLTPGYGSLAVSWTAPANGTSPTSYQGQYKESTIHVWTGASSFTTTSTRKTITGLTNGTSYNVRVRACAGTDHCGPWSPTASAMLEPALTTPSNLTVTPMSLRRAELTWTGDSNADGYTLRVENPSRRHGTVVDIPEASNVIHLDNILASEGLAHHGYFEFQVKATDSSEANLESPFSKKVRIVDNPILTGGKANGLSSAGDPQVELKWNKIDDVIRYTVRYRRLGNSPVADGNRSHSDINWPREESDDAEWPYYSAFISIPRPVSQPRTGSSVSTTYDDATIIADIIYAFQVNYVLGAGSEPAAGQLKVFSARDAYAWPSSGFPGNRERVGTYTFFGHHENRHFEYIVCGETFSDSVQEVPDGSTMLDERGRKWVGILDDAFEQWETATNGFLTVSRDQNGVCSEGPSDPGNPDNLESMREFINVDDAQNEVRMFDLTEKSIFFFPEFYSDVFKICLNFGAPACVTSFNGYSGINTESSRRTEIIEIADDLGMDNEVSLIEVILALKNLISGERKAMNTIQSVDVSFNEENFRDNPLNLPDNVSFNSCMPDASITSENPDSGYFAYRTAVHEAGHALGLSGFSLLSLANEQGRYEMAHPTIPDAAMNYDGEAGNRVNRPLSEPDCSPHPFDIIAIYALYQNVDE